MLPPAVRARAGAAVCLWPSASVCLFEGIVPRAGRAARHRPARQEWKSKVTRDSLAQPGHTPAPAHRHQDHCRWFKGDTGPGGRGGGSTQRAAHSPHLWCVVCPRPVCSCCWWWRCVWARRRPGDWRRPWMLQTLLRCWAGRRSWRTGLAGAGTPHR